MSLAWQRFTPNHTQMLYDAFSSTAAAVVAIAYGALVLGRPAEPVVLAAPLAVLAFNRILGIYSRFRIGEGRVKAVVLTGTMLLTAAVLARFAAKRVANSNTSRVR